MNNKKNIRIAIVGSQYRREITENLIENCLTTLSKNGIAKNRIEIFRVPGALEIPLIAKKTCPKEKI